MTRLLNPKSFGTVNSCFAKCELLFVVAVNHGFIRVGLHLRFTQKIYFRLSFLLSSKGPCGGGGMVQLHRTVNTTDGMGAL